MLILLCATSLLQPLFAQQATVTETVETVKTYPFSDPVMQDPPFEPEPCISDEMQGSGFCLQKFLLNLANIHEKYDLTLSELRKMVILGLFWLRNYAILNTRE